MKTPPLRDDPTPHDAALDALLAAARSERPDTSRAEYGFETRLFARLSAERAGSAGWREFTVWCWRLLPGFAAVTLAVTLWTARPDGTAFSGEDRVLAAAAQPFPADDDDFLTPWIAAELWAMI